MRGATHAVLLHCRPHIHCPLLDALPLDEGQQRGVHCVIGRPKAAGQGRGRGKNKNSSRGAAALASHQKREGAGQSVGGIAVLGAA